MKDINNSKNTTNSFLKLLKLPKEKNNITNL